MKMPSDLPPKRNRTNDHAAIMTRELCVGRGLGYPATCPARPLTGLDNESAYQIGQISPETGTISWEMDSRYANAWDHCKSYIVALERRSGKRCIVWLPEK